MNPRRFFRNLPIQQRLTLLLLTPCVVGLLLAGTVLVWFQHRTFKQTFDSDLAAVTDIVAHNSTAAITFDDKLAAAEILDALRAKKHIVGAALALPDGKLLAHFGKLDEEVLRAGSPDAKQAFEARLKLKLVATPVVLDGKRIAMLYVASDYRGVYESLLAVIGGILGLVALMVVVVAVLLSSRLQSFVSAPITRLAGTASQIADAADYSVRAAEENGAEFGVLTRAFNQMLTRIQAQDAALQKASLELGRRVEELEHEIAERVKAEQKLAELHKQLVDASRRAGMAEVASGVLHNVGNVLNSINISISLIQERLRQGHTQQLEQLSEMLAAHREDLASFLASHPKGRLVPDYLPKLCGLLGAEQASLGTEFNGLARHVEHINQIIATQQNYARLGGLIEDLPAQTLVEDALLIHAAAFIRHGITIERKFQPAPPVRVDKHKVLQILVNLLQNARHALDAAAQTNRIISVVIQAEGSFVRVMVRDNGIGIAPENLKQIFQHGFTTKSDGHGFGLHSGAIAAQQMGGKLEAVSAGPGTGATFTLELPAADGLAPKPEVPMPAAQSVS